MLNNTLGIGNTLGRQEMSLSPRVNGSFPNDLSLQYSKSVLSSLLTPLV